MSDYKRCDFTLGECDGGTIYPDGTIGCGYWNKATESCIWLDELHGRDARDFYNEQIIIAASELGATDGEQEVDK